MPSIYYIMDELDVLIPPNVYNKIVTLGHLYYMFHPNNLYSPIDYYASHITCLINKCSTYYDINILYDCLYDIKYNKINQPNLCTQYKNRIIKTLSTDIVLDDNIDSIDNLNMSLKTSFTDKYDIMPYLRGKCNELIDFFENKQFNNCKCYSCSMGDVSDYSQDDVSDYSQGDVSD